MSSMLNLSAQQREHGDFADRVFEESGEDVRKCYQCGKCSAGCSVHICGGMDVSPNRVMRMVQLGMEDEVMRTRTIWACVLCSTCTARCPRDIDIPRVMDTIRIMAKKRGITEGFNNANVFHDIFMNSIIKYGRVYEAGLFVTLKLKQSGTMFDDLSIGIPAMISAVFRMPKFPPKMKNSDQIRRVVENCKKIEGEN